MTKLVGVLNITPDSFSDGNRYNDIISALAHLKRLIYDGADIVDIGAESTRPRAVLITHQQEWKRLREILPKAVAYIKNYNKNTGNNIQISLDSRHYQTIREALKLGIDFINDVTGFEDTEMIELAVLSRCKIIVMHNLGVPADKNKIIPENLDVVKVIIDWMEQKLLSLIKAGIKKEQIIFDPGVGFGKNATQSIEILRNIDKFRVFGLPLFIGHSKKSFLDKFVQQKKNYSKESKTLEISGYLIEKNIEYLRVHDVAENKKKFLIKID